MPLNNIDFPCTNNPNIAGQTSIDSRAFEDCTKLRSITIPSSVTSIEDFAFQRCTSLTSIKIPSSVTFIGCSAFQDCTYLRSITISSGVKTISDCAFKGCTSLGSITIPSSVTYISIEAFFDCSNLKSIIYKGYSDLASCYSAFSVADIKVKVNVPSTYKDKKFCELPILKPAGTINFNRRAIRRSIMSLSRIIIMLQFS